MQLKVIHSKRNKIYIKHINVHICCVQSETVPNFFKFFFK